jgi:hypothetical protein
MINRLIWFVSALTDWLLVAAGVILALVAWWRVDVVEAKFFFIAAGVCLTCGGLWFRHRRLKKHNHG